MNCSLKSVEIVHLLLVFVLCNQFHFFVRQSEKENEKEILILDLHCIGHLSLGYVWLYHFGTG